MLNSLNVLMYIKNPHETRENKHFCHQYRIINQKIGNFWTPTLQFGINTNLKFRKSGRKKSTPPPALGPISGSVSPLPYYQTCSNLS